MDSHMHIYNTLTRRKEPFTPLEAGKVSMYVCGMTVYDYCHLGHARVMVAFDVITRYLRERGYDVNYVRNITDIDDKILKRADENGESITALTERMIDAMHEDEQRLFVLPPSHEPRATGHIDDIVAMIETLIEKALPTRPIMVMSTTGCANLPITASSIIASSTICAQAAGSMWIFIKRILSTSCFGRPLSRGGSLAVTLG
ncbi:hypothetical protein HORIV_33690 [Vreelandella olivaria]|uniref:tRNA synthetases class I catalytic domain-containing protein n=1 Tax=Vreelandella olivaria TaxID=390919 RepID=A0ABM7GJZ2_9GAMM|nr:hypothetical protein HORIV_33690 [Halomonas olivaria]